MSGLKHAVLVTAAKGRSLLSGLSELAPFQPAGVVFDPGEEDEDFSRVTAFVQSARVPVFSVAMPEPTRLVAGQALAFERHGPDLQRRLLRFRHQLAHFPGLRCRAALIEFGDEPEGPRGPASPAVSPHDAWLLSKAEARRPREEATLDLVRTLYAASKEYPDVRWLLRPSGSGRGFLDLEVATWILSELPSCHLALDPARLQAREAAGAEIPQRWWDAWAPRIRLVLLSELGRDGGTDWPFGMGLGPLPGLRDLVPRTCPRALVMPARLSVSWLLDADRLASERLSLPLLGEDGRP